jgi:tryptophan synthase alpha subunit
VVSCSTPFPQHWLWHNNAREEQICTRAGADGVIVGSAIVEIIERKFEDTDTTVRIQDQVPSLKKGFIRNYPA